MKFKVGDKVRSEVGNGEIVFVKGERPAGYLVKIKGYDKPHLRDKWWFLERHLELLEKGEANMNEKIKRDLIKALFARDFNYVDLNVMYAYKGRILTNYINRSAKFIDFIEKVENEYGINAYETSDIIIEEYDIKEYERDVV